MDLEQLTPALSRLAHAVLDAMLASLAPVAWVDFSDEFPDVTEHEFHQLLNAMIAYRGWLDD